MGLVFVFRLLAADVNGVRYVGGFFAVDWVVVFDASDDRYVNRRVVIVDNLAFYVSGYGCSFEVSFSVFNVGC